MRGLVEAVCLLAPVLAAAIRLPEAKGFETKEETYAASHALVLLNTVSRSHESQNQALELRLDVLPSKDACGYGNLTINGKVLPQTQDGDVMSGKGSISTSRKSIISATWVFQCVKVNGQPDSQLLRFIIEKVDGKATETFGLSVLFRQTGPREILRIETDLSVPDQVTANLNPNGLQTLVEEPESLKFNIEEEIFELEWMRSQLMELQYLIAEKEQAIAEHASEHFHADINGCDSLKCIMHAVAQKARKAAYVVYEKISGDSIFDEEGYHPKPPHFKKPHFKKPHFPHFPSRGNHTCGPPKGNSTRPHPKFPHRRPLPVCRYPPPPHHGHPRPPLFEKHGEYPPHFHPLDGLREGRPHHKLDGNRPLPPDFPDHEHKHEDNGPPNHPPRPPLHSDERQGAPPHIRKRMKIAKFTAIGFLITCIVVVLHKCIWNPKNRAACQARREERHRRRAYRRAAKKHALSMLIARLSGNRSDNNSDHEEKDALLADAEDGMSTTMSEEIIEFRNAVDVVEDLVMTDHEPHSMLSGSSSMTHDYELGSQVGDREELPAYEDNDGSDESSIITDGFRYTPGSSDYSPSHSPPGSASESDIFGPDTKQ